MSPRRRCVKSQDRRKPSSIAEGHPKVAFLNIFLIGACGSYRILLFFVSTTFWKLQISKINGWRAPQGRIFEPLRLAA